MTDEEKMSVCLTAAAEAAKLGEIPIAAAVYRGDELISLAANSRETEHDPTAHAEITAIRAAAQKLGGWRLIGCTLYVTLEPCAMCAGACMKSALTGVVYGAPDPKNGAFGGRADFLSLGFTEKLEVRGGVLAEECLGLIRTFFAERRAGRSERRRYWRHRETGCAR